MSCPYKHTKSTWNRGENSSELIQLRKLQPQGAFPSVLLRPGPLIPCALHSFILALFCMSQLVPSIPEIPARCGSCQRILLSMAARVPRGSLQGGAACVGVLPTPPDPSCPALHLQWGMTPSRSRMHQLKHHRVTASVAKHCSSLRKRPWRCPPSA